MDKIKSIEQLESLYGEVVPGAVTKVCDSVTPLYRQWIEASRFLVLTTVGPEGTDATPRGDVDSVVRVIDPNTLWLPDWRGNNRMDSLRNIVRDGRISLMFMVPGTNNVVRVNGTAVLTADTEITHSFEQNRKHPRSVVVITVGEVYFQCAKALMRSQLWQSADPASDQLVKVPTAGQFVAEYESDIEASAYDANYPEYAKNKMW